MPLKNYIFSLNLCISHGFFFQNDCRYAEVAGHFTLAQTATLRPRSRSFFPRYLAGPAKNFPKALPSLPTFLSRRIKIARAGSEQNPDPPERLIVTPALKSRPVILASTSLISRIASNGTSRSASFPFLPGSRQPRYA